LVQGILSGDLQMADRFVTVHYPRIYQFLLHLTGRAEDAEDLAQQTFLQAWRAMSAFRGDSSLETWLHRIAYHEYTHWLRSRRVHESLERADELPASSPQDCGMIEGILVRQALAELAPEYRETILLHYLQGLSVKEIAAVMDAPAGTVKYRLFVGRQRLRQSLTEPQEEVPRETLDVPTVP
jgi:RNA polymerase sigma-70 factor (ECF subfamily)